MFSPRMVLITFSANLSRWLHGSARTPRIMCTCSVSRLSMMNRAFVRRGNNVVILEVMVFPEDYQRLKATMERIESSLVVK